MADGDVGAPVELLLSTAPDARRSVGVGAPAVAGVVLPLEHARRARHVLRQLQLDADGVVAAHVARDLEPDLVGAGQSQHVSVEAVVGDLLEGNVVLAQPKLEVALVVGR